MISLLDRNQILAVCGTSGAVQYAIYGRYPDDHKSIEERLLASGTVPTTTSAIFTVALTESGQAVTVTRVSLVNLTGSSVSNVQVSCGIGTGMTKLHGAISIGAYGTANVSRDGVSSQDSSGNALTTAAFGAALAALNALAPAADKGVYFTSGTAASLMDLTSAGRALLDDSNAAAQRTTLGLGNASTLSVGTSAGTVAAGDDSRLAIPSDAELTALAGLTSAANKLPYFTGSGTAALLDIAQTTYTPTLTGAANLDAQTGYTSIYIRFGAIVVVAGVADVDPTLTATATRLGISLPVASNFANTYDCCGVAFASGIAAMGAAIRADTTNDRAEMVWISSDVTNQPMYYVFAYRII